MENIIARIPGTAQAKAILLVAHYDLALNGPGASDNGVGVGAPIETVRALKAGPALRNDLLLLIAMAKSRGCSAQATAMLRWC